MRPPVRPSAVGPKPSASSAEERPKEERDDRSSSVSTYCGSISRRKRLLRELHITPFETHFAVGQHRLLLGTGESHVEQTPLLLQSVGSLHSALRGEQILLHAYYIYVFVLQPLGRMDGHQGHTIIFIIIFIFSIHISQKHNILHPSINSRYIITRTLSITNFSLSSFTKFSH